VLSTAVFVLMVPVLAFYLLHNRLRLPLIIVLMFRREFILRVGFRVHGLRSRE